MNIKNYILSQCLAYLGFGAVVGYVLALNQKPLDIYLTGAFVFVCAVLSYWIGTKK